MVSSRVRVSLGVFLSLFLLLVGVTPAAAVSYWVPVGSHVAGANNSQWRTDLGLMNPNDTTAIIQIRLHTAQGVRTNDSFVPASSQLIVEDVVGQLGYNGSGVLEVVSSQPLKVSSRTFNLVASNSGCYPNGTFGQDYAAFDLLDGLIVDQVAWIGQLTEDASYRTNIGLANFGSNPASANVELYSGTGVKLTEYTVSLQPAEWKQENRPFAAKANQTNLSRGWAKVTVTSGIGVLAVASVIDNRTNDPTTFYAKRVDLTQQGVDQTVFVPVAIHAGGANNSQWRTDLGVLNPNADAVGFDVILHAAGGDRTSTALVGAGDQSILVDVVGQLGYNGSGVLEVRSDHPLVVSSRTYNLVAANASCYPNGTFGQDYAAFKSTEGIHGNTQVFIGQLTENSSYRTNIGLANIGPGPATVLVELFNATGTRLADYTVSLQPGEWKQENRPFATFGGQSDMAAGAARVTVSPGTVTSGISVLVMGSVIDNLTNDPTTFAAIR